MKRGQAGTVFKMMVGAAFAVAFLVVILHSSEKIKCPTYCATDIKELTVQALNMPGSCFEKTVCFDKGAVLNEAYFKKALDLNYFKINSNLNTLHCSFGSCQFDFKANLPVSVKCSSTSSCTATIGKTCS